MRKWGLVVSLFYAAVVVLLLVPCEVALIRNWTSITAFRSGVMEFYGYWITWVWVGVLVLGQVLLIALSANTSGQRLKPRTRIVFSIAAAGLLLAVLTVSVVSSVAVAIRGDLTDDSAWAILIGGLAVPWIVWAIAFYRYSRDTEDIVTRAVTWLLRGSVLELLVAVPSHVIVRRRHDCCAPAVTGFGIATGIAIMLLSFGPSVLFLFKKRMDRLKAKGVAA
jgi:hypothetical protein